MKRKIIAAAAALAGAAGIGIVNAAPADAYAYWRNGYFYADTSYARNVSGSYAKIVARRDVARQIIYIHVYLYDTVTDNNVAAVRFRAWDRQTGKWVGYAYVWINNSGERAQTEYHVSFDTDVADTIIMQDGIRGKIYGTNSVAIFKRYA